MPCTCLNRTIKRNVIIHNESIKNESLNIMTGVCYKKNLQTVWLFFNERFSQRWLWKLPFSYFYASFNKSSSRKLPFPCSYICQVQVSNIIPEISLFWLGFSGLLSARNVKFVIIFHLIFFQVVFHNRPSILHQIDSKWLADDTCMGAYRRLLILLLSVP